MRKHQNSHKPLPGITAFLIKSGILPAAAVPRKLSRTRDFFTTKDSKQPRAAEPESNHKPRIMRINANEKKTPEVFRWHKGHFRYWQSSTYEASCMKTCTRNKDIAASSTKAGFPDCLALGGVGKPDQSR